MGQGESLGGEGGGQPGGGREEGRVGDRAEPIGRRHAQQPARAFRDGWAEGNVEQAALSVFGLMMTLVALYQQLFNGVAQALQPIVSPNFGAGRRARVKRTFWVAAQGGALTALSLLFPIGTVRVFTHPTPEILAVAPGIVRGLALAFLPMALAILASGYLQALMRTGLSVGLALMRSLALSLALLLILPPLVGLTGVWLAITATEWLTLGAAVLALLALWGKETAARR